MAHRIYINIHQVQQAFGGPEEGGWYYSVGTPLKSIQTRSCVCDLPTETSPVWEDWDTGQKFPPRRYLYIGHDAHDPGCPLIERWDRTRDKYIGVKDTYFPQADGDDSPEFLGECLSSGTIQVSIDTRPGKPYPEGRPFYS